MKSLRTIDFKSCLFEVFDGYTRTTFREDGSVNELHVWYISTEKWYLDICEAHGYGLDWRKYSTDHDVTHHWLAQYFGHDHSEAIWLGAHGVLIPQDEWHETLAHEEHMVNSLQRYVMMGLKDDHGCLDWIFGGNLHKAVADLKHFLQG
jgi:hypothetical protein